VILALVLVTLMIVLVTAATSDEEITVEVTRNEDDVNTVQENTQQQKLDTTETTTTINEEKKSQQQLKKQATQQSTRNSGYKKKRARYQPLDLFDTHARVAQRMNRMFGSIFDDSFNTMDQLFFPPTRRLSLFDDDDWFFRPRPFSMMRSLRPRFVTNFPSFLLDHEDNDELPETQHKPEEKKQVAPVKPVIQMSSQLQDKGDKYSILVENIPQELNKENIQIKLTNEGSNSILDIHTELKSEEGQQKTTIFDKRYIFGSATVDDSSVKAKFDDKERTLTVEIVKKALQITTIAIE
jgi:hypothetical protein